MTTKIENNLFLQSGLLMLVACMSAGIASDALRTNFSEMSDALAITAYSSIIFGAAVCCIGVFKNLNVSLWFSGLFPFVAGLASVLMATAEPADLENSVFLIPVFMYLNLILAILGVLVIGNKD